MGLQTKTWKCNFALKSPEASFVLWNYGQFFALPESKWYTFAHRFLSDKKYLFSFEFKQRQNRIYIYQLSASLSLKIEQKK